MALNGDALGGLIVTAINGLSASDKEDLSKVWNAIGGEIVTHITTAGVVTVTGVTSGSGSAPGIIT